ncbi:ABC transporter, partial [human gut metagenome]
KLLTCRGKLAFTLIFITHDMELAVVIADVILVMRNSTLIEQVEFSGDISVFTSEYSKTLLYASGITDT